MAVHALKPEAKPEPKNFEDMVWLFSCDNRNRGTLRQNFNEAALLWRAVRSSEGPILEVGRCHGGSTVLLLEAAGPDRKVTSIDIKPSHFASCQAIFDDMERSQPERIDLVVGNSRETLPGREYGFLYIDGDHSYEGVKLDTKACWNQLKNMPGAAGQAVYHDAWPNDGLKHAKQINHCEGVLKLINELTDGGYAKVLETAGSMVWLEKLKDIPEDF